MDNATYTIKNVTDNVTVTVANKIGKTYTINYVAVSYTHLEWQSAGLLCAGGRPAHQVTAET